MRWDFAESLVKRARIRAAALTIAVSLFGYVQSIIRLER